MWTRFTIILYYIESCWRTICNIFIRFIDRSNPFLNTFCVDDDDNDNNYDDNDNHRDDDDNDDDDDYK